MGFVTLSADKYWCREIGAEAGEKRPTSGKSALAMDLGWAS